MYRHAIYFHSKCGPEPLLNIVLVLFGSATTLVKEIFYRNTHFTRVSWELFNTFTLYIIQFNTLKTHIYTNRINNAVFYKYIAESTFNTVNKIQFIVAGTWNVLQLPDFQFSNPILNNFLVRFPWNHLYYQELWQFGGNNLKF